MFLRFVLLAIMLISYPVSAGPKKRKENCREACDNCRRQKIRCIKKSGPCSHCVTKKEECTFLMTRKKRGPKTKAINIKKLQFLGYRCFTDAGHFLYKLDNQPMMSSDPVPPKNDTQVPPFDFFELDFVSDELHLTDREKVLDEREKNYDVFQIDPLFW